MKFEDLKVWKRASRLSAELYIHFRKVPDYGFRDQITRAGLSIPSNIAEGFERDSPKESVRFLSYARGSSGELRTQVYIGIEIGYIDKETGHRWIEETRAISSMINNLMATRRRFDPPINDG